MKEHARVVIIGGGVAGCSTAYHLAAKGWSDIVLLERDELTSGSTWHAAGNCPTYSTSYNIMRMQAHGVFLYQRLEELTGQPVGHHMTGSVRLAQTRDRMDEFSHIAAMARHQGLEYEMLDLDGLRARYPPIETHGLEGALWDPHDGHIDPSQLTQALAKGARDGGVRIHRQTPVTAIERTAAGEWRVTTPQGEITAEILINAAGYRAREVGAMTGLDLPLVSMEHQYLVTEAVPSLEERGGLLPLLRDPDDSYYLRQERGGLILGPYEFHCRTWAEDGVPPDFGMELLQPDLDRLESYIEKAILRVPPLGESGVRNTINGPIPYTPDGLPLVGPAAGQPNHYLCAAFSFGIVQGGGAGKLLADIIVEGEGEWDTWEIDPRRYGRYATKRYAIEKAVELYSHEYTTAFPHDEWPAGRPARRTPLYETLKAKGARFGARGGWERATWFVPEGSDGERRPSFRHTNWFDTVGAECRAVRERVGVLDLGGFAKYMVGGADAAAMLDRVVTGRLPRVGRIALGYACLESGHVISEFTITRLAEDRFYIASAAAAEDHDLDLLRNAIPAGADVEIENATGRYGTLIVAGPRSREVLGAVTEAELSNEAFPWLAAQWITVGFADCLAIRVNYVGELGWELHLPMEHMATVYEDVMAAGAAHGIADFGMYAMESLRLEKAYPAWKLELTSEYTPLEAGLDRFVRLDKDDFVGRAALQRQKQEGVARRLVCMTLAAGDCDPMTNAPVYCDGEIAGIVTSGGHGHTIGRAIALAYIEAEAMGSDGALEIEILGQRRAATLSAGAPHDPGNARLRA